MHTVSEISHYVECEGNQILRTFKSCVTLWLVNLLRKVSDLNHGVFSLWQVFLDEAGMELFLSVLHKFPGEPAIETKVLGLLNNIAEVPGLRQHLMVVPFIDILR